MTTLLPVPAMAPVLTIAHVARLADLGRAVQARLAATRLSTVRNRRVRLVDVLALGPGNRLAVVDFAGRELLLSVTKQGVTLVAEESA